MKTVRSDRSGADDIAALKAAARLHQDERWQEFAMQIDREIREATSRALIRFRLAGYKPSDALPALSFALVHALTIVHRDFAITPDDLGRLAARALTEARKRKS
jgi:hypothetical protein